MRYKEFEKKIEDWGRKYGYVTEVTVHDFHTYVEIEIDEESHYIASISDIYMFELDTGWKSTRKIKNHARGELLDVLVEFAKTPIEDRKDKKRFIIPLPNLITTDGEQQYLSHNYVSFFASKRNKSLKQIWKEEYLKFVPEIYRQFAVEFNEGKEH